MNDYRSIRPGNVFLLAGGLAAGLLTACGGSSSTTATPPVLAPVLAYSEADFVYLTGVIAPPLEPLEQLSGTTGYAIDPALPTGLLLDPVSGSITGTPSDPSPATLYTITAEGVELSATLELEVREEFGAPRFALGLDWNGGQIQTFRVDAETGELIAGPVSPADQFPFRGVADALGRFAYVAHFGTGNLGVYAIDQDTGALTIVQLVQLGSATIDLVLSPDGRFLYAADVGLDVVALFEIDPADGLLVPTSQFLPIADPSGLAITADGASLFATSLTGNLVAAFDLDPATGAFISARGTVATPSPFDLALTPDEGALYTCNFGVDAVTGIAIDGAGILDRIESWSTSAEPVSLTVDSTGERLSVATFGGGEVIGFEIQPNKQLLETSAVQLGGLLGGSNELGVGGRVLAAIFDDGLAATVQTGATAAELLDGSRTVGSGTLVDLVPVRTATSATLTPEHVYAANISGGNTSALRWDGILSQLGDVAAPVASGAKPSDVAVTPDGRFVYVAEELSGEVIAFRRDVDDGTLSKPIETVAAGVLTRALTISDDGSQLLVVGNSGLTQFFIDPASGTLTEAQTILAGLAPEDVAIDTRGRMVYVANRNSGNISVFDSSSGSLVEIAGSPFDNGLTSSPRSMALSPDGALLAVTSSNFNEVRLHRIDRQTGALTLEQDLTVGLDPRGLAWSIDGRTLYVTLSDANAVAVVRRGADDVLDLVTTHSAGLDPKAVTVDPSGELLYTVAFASNTIEVFEIGIDGSLLHVDSAPVGAGSGPDAAAAAARWIDLND